MSQTLTDKVANAVIERGWNEGDLGAMDAVVARGYVRHLSDGRTLRGRDAFKAHITSLRALMPDLRTDVHDRFGDEQNGAARFTTTATLANGKALRFDGAVVVRYEGGMLAEEWEFFDTAVIAAATQP